MIEMITFPKTPARCLFALMCALSLSLAPLVGQVRTPTHSRVSYGPEDRQWLNLYLPSGGNPAAVFLYAHHSGSTADDVKSSWADPTVAAGTAIVSWESIAKVQGLADFQACAADAKVMFAWVKKHAATYNFDIDKIIIGGQSRGSFVSWELALSRDPGIVGIYMGQALPGKSFNKRLLEPITKSAPPIFLAYRKEPGVAGDIHDPAHGLRVLERYKELGIGDRAELVHSLNDTKDNQVMQFLPKFIRACSVAFSANAEEIRPGVFRTPDERFENLKDYPFEPHYLEVDSKIGKLRVHYVDVGPRDADPILLMHGEPSWSYLYRDMIPPLVAAGHRVIAPDLIGFGRSDKPARRTDHSYPNHVDWMMQFITELDLKNITLFCQDWGSLIGLRLVTGAPDRFARVVAGNAALPAGPGKDGVVLGGQWTEPDPKAELKFEEGFMPWVKFSQTAPELDCGLILQLATIRKLTVAELDAYRAPFPDERYKAGPRVMPTLVRSQMATNRKAWKILGQFDKPFLTTFSDSDPITKGGEKVFQKRVPGAEGQPHTIIMHASHFLQEDASEQLARIIIDLIAANPTPATKGQTQKERNRND
jgi:haloalkane dehalogenase